MRYWRSKAICSLILAAFLVAEGLALARTLRQTYCCQTDAEFARSEAGPGCCENCECKPTTVAAESTVTLPGPAKDGLRPSCPAKTDHVLHVLVLVDAATAPWPRFFA